MSIIDPSRLEVAMFTAMARTVGHREYRKFVDSLGLRGSERVMDFGSGPGVIAGLIAERLTHDGGSVLCVDISKTWIEVAKRRLGKYSNIEYMLGDIRTMQIPEASFDVIGVHYVLHDVDAKIRPGVVAALARALKSNGRIMIDEPARSGHSMPQEEVRRLLGEAGLKEVKSKMNWLSYLGEFREQD